MTLTATQRRLLSSCAQYWMARRYSPSLRELLDLAGISSTSVVASNLRRLERMGLISYAGAGVARSICLTEAGWAETGIAPPLAVGSQP